MQTRCELCKVPDSRRRRRRLCCRHRRRLNMPPPTCSPSCRRMWNGLRTQEALEGGVFSRRHPLSVGTAE